MGRVTPLLTSRKVLNITYRTPLETLLKTPETLPTEEPTVPQISYTVAEEHLPTFSFPPYGKKWVALLYGAGKFVTAGILHWKTRKNGAAVASGSASVSANYYYTVNAFFFDVAVGDVLELALWSNQTDSNWDYKAFQVQVTRLIPFNKPRLLRPCNFSSVPAHPVLTLGNPSVSGTSSLHPYHNDRLLPSISGITEYASLYVGNTYGIFRIYRGDYSTSTSVSTSSTYRPYYYRNWVPTQIIMRGLRID